MLDRTAQTRETFAGMRCNPVAAMVEMTKPVTTRLAVFIVALLTTAALLAVVLSAPRTEAATVTLQTPETQNVDDGMVIQVSPALEYGAHNQMSAGAPGINRDRQAYIKWSLASLPAGATVTNASLQLYYATDGLETDDRISLDSYAVTPYPSYSVNGQEWTEGTGGSSGDVCTGAELCWNTRPTGGQVSGSAESSVLFDGSVPHSGWYTWAVTQMVQQAVNNGDGRLTISLRSTWLGGSEGSSDFVTFRTKEHYSTSLRPKLVIEYTTGGATPTATPTPASTPTPTRRQRRRQRPRLHQQPHRQLRQRRLFATATPSATPPPSGVDGCETSRSGPRGPTITARSSTTTR